MRRVRVIPSLLIKNGGLVKSVKFGNYQYIGDPINAVKIFNEKEIDEIVVLDISATAERRSPDFEKIKWLTSEAFMPLAYGGGITKLDEIKSLIQLGVEKVIMNSVVFSDPTLVDVGAKYVGSQSVVVSIDVKKDFWGTYRVYSNNGTKKELVDPIAHATEMERRGAGELLVNAIDRDGTFSGYDLDLVKKFSEAVSIPVVPVGGAASIDDFVKAISAGASAVAAGSMFVLQRPHRAVLITYPQQSELKTNLFEKIGP